jgi:hypothetical protein
MSVWFRGFLIAVMSYLLHENLVPAALALAVVMLALRTPAGASSTCTSQPFHYQSHISRLPPMLSQDDDDDDETEVSANEIEKYVSVYKAMQRNRSLTVEQAAAAQGLTLEQFRQLENRVQRDDAALQQARDELQAAAQGSPTPNGKH